MLSLLVTALTCLLNGRFSAFLCFFLEIIPFKMATRHHAKVLSNPPKLLKKAEVHCREASFRHCSSVVGCEFKVNESIIYINKSVFKQKHVKQGYVLIG